MPAGRLAHLLVLALTLGVGVAIPFDGLARPGAAPPPVAELADRCRRMAIENVDEVADPAFRAHVPGYQAVMSPKKGGEDFVTVELKPPPEKRDYQTGFACSFRRPWWSPSLVIFEKMTWKRPPISELRERCRAGAVRKASGLAAGLSSYTERDQIPVGDDAVTIDLRPPAAETKRWTGVSCHLSAPWWAPEVTFFSSASGGGATLEPAVPPTP